MKKHLFTFFCIAITFISMAQTTATNFTCNDCAGVSHDLFSVLDSGKVIVLIWVMPCSSCVPATKTSYNVVNSYQTTYPGKVYFYLADDLANTSCTSLDSWANSIAVPQSAYSTSFSDAHINYSDYGTPGMPKIVALAGTDHRIIYNSNNTVNATILQDSINSFLQSPSGIFRPNNDPATINIMPNPANETTGISFYLSSSSVVKMEIFNSAGKLIENIKTAELPGGNNNLKINTSNYNTGLYFVRLTDGDRTRTVQFNITH
ncbi:MAG: T9SS type A sorting domain-containing protein [Bacteroidia bacterium]|nr:T9SS type A sorting domain-containing protein [Bacteroidia bacterium]